MPESEENPVTPESGAPAETPPAVVEGGDDGNPVEGADSLGDAGKKALDAMKSKWHAERDKRRELEAKLAERDKPKADDAPDADARVREAQRKANARILRSEVKAAATGKLADPSDAYRYLDLDAFEVDENGEVDAEEIATAITDLLTAKPYLAAATAKRFKGTGDGGAARKATGPTQLTRADLASMSPAEIVKAKAEGRLTNLMSGN
ncbi:hypothetical protein [Streptomyces sp. SP17KL33]|uniref:hypothetical protein n=1 Tax=Streptomyces sp. SP17KL33 TaxID=3002534 RepID=UPI002E759AB8|nr:hypothetical protein [Streptomyces sp. SP17KL33]MEE1835755.1 hypothetical protein [Streptomyces sp. SP17KL33]